MVRTAVRKLGLWSRRAAPLDGRRRGEHTYPALDPRLAMLTLPGARFRTTQV